MTFLEKAKNVAIGILSLAAIGAIFTGLFIGFIIVLGKVMG